MAKKAAKGQKAANESAITANDDAGRIAAVVFGAFQAGSGNAKYEKRAHELFVRMLINSTARNIKNGSLDPTKEVPQNVLDTAYQHGQAALAEAGGAGKKIDLADIMKSFFEVKDKFCPAGGAPTIRGLICEI
jgi:hypothetical protein